MAAEPDPKINEDDRLEQTELVRRLRRMQWPPAPSEVKERVLERVLSRHKSELDSGGDNGAADPAADPDDGSN